MASNIQKSLAVAMIQNLRNDIASGKFDADHNESLEIAIQCLESGYDLKGTDFDFQPSKPLIDTFKDAENLTDEPMQAQEIDEETMKKAEEIKNFGNELMKKEKYQEAIDKYSEAIALCKRAPFFCNRAAAYSRLDQNDLCIQDCRTAISLDASYAKAYARLGLALSQQFRYQEAVDAYKKALELDPPNASYKNNLEIAEEKARDAQQQQRTPQANPFAGLGGGGGMPGGFDIGAMLNNPAMMQMANQMMSNPQMQQTMAQMMQGLMSNQDGQGGGGIQDLLSVGQRLAQAMQSQNPELVEQLRQQTRQNQNPDNTDNQGSGGDNPPPGSG